MTLCLGIVFTKTVFALPFGIYEPRSLAMGGAGVASATSVNAVFYNPAILSTYKDYKDKAINEAFSFPVVSARVSRAVETLVDQQDVNYQNDITTSFAAYNTDRSPATAQTALDTINSLYGTLGKLANNVFLLDASASLVIGVPTKFQGGAFFVTTRGVGDGQLSIPATDLTLVNNYQQALQLIVAGNPAQAQLDYPDQFDGSGNLINPSANITAEANARAAHINEMGIGLSKQIKIFGSDYSLGLTPKMVQVTTYEYHQSLNNSTQDKQGTTDDDWQINFDVGVLKRLTAQWRLGLVVKNAIERTYLTASGQTFTIKPQWRVGAAYTTPAATYTMDLDLLSNEGVYPGNAAQFLLTGVEFKQGFLRYRLGYRESIAHKGPKEAGVFSAGLGLNIKPVYLDLAYSENHQQRAASLMFGFNF